ncbi:hypothetical protein MPLB_1820023 [Mesorhizobium sp. ORS 3324]|nr:hypothetical protein MPLB_1820023 [Mesorhizobium sp. ORS 3324]
MADHVAGFLRQRGERPFYFDAVEPFVGNFRQRGATDFLPGGKARPITAHGARHPMAHADLAKASVGDAKIVSHVAHRLRPDEIEKLLTGKGMDMAGHTRSMAL